jgi:hypothetical protein
MVLTLRFNCSAICLVDTMGDMIVNMVGALLVSLIGYFYMKKGMRSAVELLILKFIYTNPGMFGRDLNHEGPTTK